MILVIYPFEYTIYDINVYRERDKRDRDIYYTSATIKAQAQNIHHIVYAKQCRLSLLTYKVVKYNLMKIYIKGLWDCVFFFSFVRSFFVRSDLHKRLLRNENYLFIL